MSKQSDAIHAAPPLNDDNSLFLVYAPPHIQDWLHTIMQWKKVDPINVSPLEPQATIASWTTEKNPDAIIYSCEIWSEAEENVTTNLRTTFPCMAIIVLFEQGYCEKTTKDSLRAVKCIAISKNSVGDKVDIISALKRAQHVLTI